MRQSAHGLRHHAIAGRRPRLPSLLALGALVLATTQTGSEARAHGPAPVALAVLAHDGSAPLVLRTNVGLAVAEGDGTYAYVCPARWDENPAALAASSADGRELLVHSAGVAYLSRDAGCTFTPLTGDELYVIAAAATARGFVLVAEPYPDDLDPTRSLTFEVVAGVMSPLSVDVPGAIDGLLETETGWVISGHTPTGFVADETGVLATFETSASRLTPRVQAAGDVWLRTTVSGTVGLARVRGGTFEASAQSATTVQGPVLVGGRWLALFDGELFEHGDEWTPVGEVPWTCLRTFEGRSFACSLEALAELEDDGGGALPRATPVFSMLQLGPPQACGDAAAQEACGLDWAHYGGESGWLDTLPAVSATTPRRMPVMMGEGGCAARSGPPLPWWLLVGLALAARRRQAPRSS